MRNRVIVCIGGHDEIYAIDAGEAITRWMRIPYELSVVINAGMAGAAPAWPIGEIRNVRDTIGRQLNHAIPDRLHESVEAGPEAFRAVMKAWDSVKFEPED